MAFNAYESSSRQEAADLAKVSIKECFKDVLQSALSRPFDSINDINTEREVWKLPVKIVNIWYERDSPRKHHIEMVVMDSNCDRIQIVVPSPYVDSWGVKLVEFQTYVFNNFKVQQNDLLSRACPNTFKLIWFDRTFISSELFPPIPNVNFFFKDFAEILSENFHPDDIHDIIGMVHEITFHQRKDNNVAAVRFVLQDNKRVLLECFLWGEQAANFLTGVRHNVGLEPNVLIIRNAIYCAAYDDWPISLSNGSHGTRIFTDQSLPEIIEFKKSLPKPHEPVVTIRIGEMLNAPLNENDQNFSLVDNKIMRIQHLIDLEQLPCITIGNTEKISVSKDGWTFEGCAWCGRDVFVSEGYLRCSNDHKNPRVTPRYKLSIEMNYHEEKAIFIFSDPACANFFGISALELKRSLSSENQVQKRFYPLMLDNILGLKIVTKGKWSPTFNILTLGNEGCKAWGHYGCSNSEIGLNVEN
ncbi:hypothetical protein P8452_11196 [Trifolium repens]|nr:hypothetical protein P8452_11196 [Trifolium repens]